MTKLLKTPKDIITLGIAALVVVVLAGGVVYGICYGLWYAMGYVPGNTARLWALLATVALPVVAVITWRLALRYERGLVKGLDLGVGQVAKAGKDAATLRVGVHNAVKKPPQPQPSQWQVELPQTEIFPRLSDGRDVIKL